MTYRGAVIDVDGTVVRGDEPIAGAPAALDRLAAAGVRRLFVSNNPTKAPPAYVDRFARAGIDVEASEVVTAGTVAAAYLRDRHAGDALFVVGDPGLVEQFEAAGLSVTAAREAADVCVVSVDSAFSYDRLCEAMWLLEDESVPFVGTDPDMTIPAVDRDVPGSGAMINAVAGVAGRDPDIVLGKPSAPARRTALNRLGLPPEDCFVVGDRLDTDIAFGERAGMTTALVRTGVTDDDALAAAGVEPDYVLDSLADVDRVLDGRA